MSELFRAKVATFGPRLMHDAAIGREETAAFFGNFGRETDGFRHFFQIGIPEWGGGVSWAQWDKTRRDDFRAWCTAHGLDPKDDEAAYGFLVHELRSTWEGRVLPAVRTASGLDEKTLTVMRLYERPGVKAEASRIEWAQIALDVLQGGAVATEPASQPKTSTMIPSAWLPAAKMQRVIVHWTAGGHRASQTDVSHYHILIEGDGRLVRGTHSIKDNEANLQSGRYAAHTLNCNTGSIGVSMCCMAGAKENPFDPGSAPMTREQWDKMIDVVAQLCRRYGIPVGPKTVLTHAEVQGNLGIQQRGKWDVARLTFDPSVQGAKAVGDRMRREIAVWGAVAPSDDMPAEPTAPAPPPPVGKPKPGDGAAAATGAAILLTLGAAWAFARAHLPEIIIGAAVLAALSLAVYRVRKGHWPWTGNQSQVLSPPSLPSSEPSWGQLSAALSELQSVASQAEPLQEPLESKPPPKPSARRSRATRKPSASSKSSKRPKASKSARKRKSKSSD